jgi:3-dehydroquinate synthase
MELKAATYNIYFSEKPVDIVFDFDAQEYSKIAVLVDSNTHKYCLPKFKSVFPYNIDEIIEIPSGESHKNIRTCRIIWDHMMSAKIDRDSLLINLGGGVIGDMGGFCASTFKRGLRFIQVPTTLLSQVDASVGGKLGIDYQGVKNIIGVFNNPESVLICEDFLSTLPKRELHSGFAEVAKHGLIENQNLWGECVGRKSLESDGILSQVFESVKVKLGIVNADPFEKGIRKKLNFGHTIGHALETLSLETDNPLLHGEAIAIGMICESWISTQLGALSVSELVQIVKFFKKWFHIEATSLADLKILIDLIQQDKKNTGSILNFSLLDEIGQCRINVSVEKDMILKSLEYYNKVIIK